MEGAPAIRVPVGATPPIPPPNSHHLPPQIAAPPPPPHVPPPLPPLPALPALPEPIPQNNTGVGIRCVAVDVFVVCGLVAGLVLIVFSASRQPGGIGPW